MRSSAANAIDYAKVGHPFDTIKVRLQTADKSQFSGPIRCVVQTARNEGVSGFYKGVTPPLVGWMAMDSMYDTALCSVRTLGFGSTHAISLACLDR